MGSMRELREEGTRAGLIAEQVRSKLGAHDQELIITSSDFSAEALKKAPVHPDGRSTLL